MTESPIIGESDVVLLRLGNRSFRKRLLPQHQTPLKLGDFMPNMRPYEEEYFDWADAVDDDDDGIGIDSNGDFFCTMEIPPVFFKFIVGKGGRTKLSIENDCKTKITIPKEDRVGEMLKVAGATKNAVLKAKTKIEIICETAKENLPYTHFICIPLNYQELTTSVEKFQQTIIQEAEKTPIEGFDPSIASPTAHFHLTILMLKLYTEKEVQKVKDIMTEITPKIYDLLETRSMLLRFKGLEIMNDDPSQVNVLYLQALEVDSSNRLAKVTKFIVDQFKKHDLLTPEQDRPVKLHATLFNTKHRKTPTDTPKDTKPFRETFNAHGILSKYQNHDFGTLKIPELHLSQRGSYDKNGFYKCIAKIIFP